MLVYSNILLKYVNKDAYGAGVAKAATGGIAVCVTNITHPFWPSESSSVF